MENGKKAIGTYGYIDELKQKSRTNMIVYIVFAVVLFVVPPIIMKTMLNAFTVAAVVMLIPAFSGFKQYMNIKEFNSCPAAEYQKISEIVKGKLYMVLLSDLVLSSQSGEMMLNMAIIYNNNIYGYAPEKNKGLENIEALLTELLTEINITKKPVVHDDFEEFVEMVTMLAANEPSTQQDVGGIYHQIESICI